MKHRKSAVVGVVFVLLALVLTAWQSETPKKDAYFNSTIIIGGDIMYNSKDFARRLSELRLIKSISARDMSLSLGQSESYINKIENSKAFPSMEMFFYICDFLNISPKDFFDYNVKNPNLIEEIIQDLNSIDYNYVKNIHEIIKGLKN